MAFVSILLLNTCDIDKKIKVDFDTLHFRRLTSVEHFNHWELGFNDLFPLQLFRFGKKNKKHRELNLKEPKSAPEIVLPR